MNHENLALLTESINSLEFSKSEISEQLAILINKGVKEFYICTEKYFEDNCKLEALLFIKKRDDQDDSYFLEKYMTLLRYTKEPDRERGQTFFPQMGVTFREAFNLLQGRSVYKNNLPDINGEKYNAWINLNFEEKDVSDNYKVRQFTDSHEYDLEKVLQKYSIDELNQPESKAWLILLLKKGERQPVHINIERGKTRIMFIEANPMLKSIGISPHRKTKSDNKK
jgi:hypothetical protein